MTTPAEKIVQNTTLAVIARGAMILTPILFTALAGYVVKIDGDRSTALLAAQQEIAQLKTWREVTQQRMDRDLSQLSADLQELKRETKTSFSVLGATSERLLVAVEGITVTLRMMQGVQRSVMVSNFGEEP